MWLIREILASWPIDGGEKGIPIGNLTSQFFANVYLHEMDKFMKHDLGAKFYVRYMDDAVTVHGDRAWLHDAKERLRRFLRESLMLELNSKTSIFPAAQGVNFLGYRIWPTHRLLRKNSVRRMRRKLKRFEGGYAAGEFVFDEINASVQSWVGHAVHADTYNLRRKMFGEFVLRNSATAGGAVLLNNGKALDSHVHILHRGLNN